ncbi:MAG: hypothetical protein MJ215_04510 [Spirochaetia bacterium]|nr:hypothetical protein [Spirochaetia bacterium]
MPVLNKRNIVISCFSLLSIFCMLGFITFLLFLSSDLPQTFMELLVHPNILIPLSSILFSFFSVYFIKKFFIRNTRAEVFFFVIFLLSLSFDGVRSIIFIFQLLVKPDIYSVYLSRILIFGKMMGVFSLLCFSMMNIETEYKPFATLCSFALIISFFIAAIVPLSPVRAASSVYLPGQMIFRNSIILLMFIIILTLIFNYLQNRNWEYLNLAVSILLIFIGSWILFFTISYLWAFLGMCFLTTGTIFVTYRIHKLYLWY